MYFIHNFYFFLYYLFHTTTPDGRRPRRAVKAQDLAIRIARNGWPPTTLPEPIKRARDKDLRGFAGEGNVVERSERYASVAKPEEP